MKVRVLSREFYGCTGIVENGELNVYINGKKYEVPFAEGDVELLPEDFMLETIPSPPIRWAQK